MELPEQIAENLRRAHARISAAAARVGRNPAEITLIAITKYVGIEEVRILRDAGLRHFGENRLNAIDAKRQAAPDGVWHMIAPLQRRKIRDAVGKFQRFDAIDRPQFAEILQKRCAEAGQEVEVLLELNISGEEAKHGYPVEQVEAAVDTLRGMNHLQLRGLMTMAPFEAPEAELRQIFRTLRTLADQHGLPVRSMGMTSDYEIAIEEGATEVRLGRVLFESSGGKAG